ncbi:F0F1 ATP synthase subunit epsilon, partial [archaeon]
MFSTKLVARLIPKVAQRGFAAAATEASGPAAQLVLNFTTPHQPLYNKKVVEQVILPGAAGEYGVTANHSPVISELRPGVVTVIHAGVSLVCVLFGVWCIMSG